MRGTAIRFRIVGTTALLATWHLVLLVQHAPLEDAAEMIVAAVHGTILE